MYGSQSDVAVAEQHVQAALLAEAPKTLFPFNPLTRHPDTPPSTPSKAHAEVAEMDKTGVTPPEHLTNRIAKQEELLHHAGQVAEERGQLSAVAKT